MKKWIILIIAVLIIAGGFYIFGPLREQRQATASAEYQTVTAERGDLTATVGATGVVRANQTALLTWLTSGTVDDVKVGIGEQIVKDQELATLEITSLPQAIILAQADLVSAQKALDDLLNSQLQRAQALQAELSEINGTLEELKKQSDDTVTYKAVGQVMFKVEKPAIEEELEDRQKTIEMMLASTTKQTEKLAEQLKELQSKIEIELSKRNLRLQ